MSVKRFTRAILGLTVATAMLAASAGAAQAADKSKPIDFTVRTDTSPIAPQAPTVKWDATVKGKWGVTLNLQQPDTRASNWNDVQAGAYYRITPSLRVGGAVAFGDQQPLPGAKPATPEGGQPRVQLETKFKF